MQKVHPPGTIVKCDHSDGRGQVPARLASAPLDRRAAAPPALTATTPPAQTRAMSAARRRTRSAGSPAAFPTLQPTSVASPVAPARGGRARPRGELRAEVSQRLRTALMAGQFVPGQVLSLRQLAQQLGTSPMPVRSALAQLISSGVLETLPSGSVAVGRMTPRRFVELTRVRKALEGMAAEMACRNAAPRLLPELQRINERLHRAIAQRDILACLRLNQSFHFTLYAASESDVLPPLIESLWLRAGPFMYFSLAAPATPWDASGHDRVIAALRRGDARATRQAIEQDIGGSATYLTSQSTAFPDAADAPGSRPKRASTPARKAAVRSRTPRPTATRPASAAPPRRAAAAPARAGARKSAGAGRRAGG